MCIFIYYMSSQKSKSNKSRSKNTIPKTKPSDYLNKYVGNTPENVRRMREIFKTDGEIYRKFPYLTKGDDRDFHIFYEYVENKHLLDEKKIFPFEDVRDYSFLYWFLDEIVPQNWDKLGTGQDREKKKFRDGYYLNTSEIIEQADLNKYESLISTTMFRQSRGVMPLPPLGKEDKNNASKWRNWKIEYAKWKNQEYKLHPELSRSRDERSAPRELDEDDDDAKPLVHNWNKTLAGFDKTKFGKKGIEFEDSEGFKYVDDYDPSKPCASNNVEPYPSDDISKYYEQEKLFASSANEGCQKDSRRKKAILWDLFREKLEKKPCNVPPISKENDRVGGIDKDDGFYTTLKSQTDENSKNKLAEAVKIYENRIKFYQKSIDKFDTENNPKCKTEAEEILQKYLGLNRDLFEIVSGKESSVTPISPESSDDGRSLPSVSTLTVSPSPRSISTLSSRSPKIKFDDLFNNFGEYDGFNFMLNFNDGDSDQSMSLGMLTNRSRSSENYLIFKDEYGTEVKIHKTLLNGESLIITTNRSRMMVSGDYYFEQLSNGGKKSLRKTKRNKSKKRQTKRRR